MLLTKQSHEILNIDLNLLQKIERAGRTCYKSEDKITDNSAEKFVEKILKLGHESVIEHSNMTVKFITNRGVTHELVRHRLASYSQESTRYVRYDNIEFIIPVWFSSILKGTELWMDSMLQAEEKYRSLLNIGWKPQEAREVLPNSLKTEIVMTANMREWRHVLNLRCGKAAHPQIRDLMLNFLEEAHTRVPIIFNDLYERFFVKE